MKRLLLCCSLVALYIGITSIAPPAKSTYFSKEAGVSVVFPSQFTKTTQNEESYSTEKAQVVLDERVYMAVCTFHKNELQVSEYDKLLEVSLEAFLEGLGCEIWDQELWKVKKNKGVKASFEVPDKGLKGEYRVVFRNNIQYQIAVVCNKENWNQKIADTFLNSFKLKK